MNTLQSQFIVWYFNEFAHDPLFVEMTVCSEDSKWHREKTVATHTNMVVGEYIAAVSGDWTRNDLLGAIACAFHDVGKPKARTEKHNEERGVYYSYGGHEIISARLWEDWVARNWNRIVDVFDFVPEDVYKVNWLIEHHRPWGLKDVTKRRNLYTTAELTVGVDVYFRMLRADNWGRIGDTQLLNRQGVDVWLKTFTEHNEEYATLTRNRWTDETDTIPKTVAVADRYQPTLNVLIGCSGSGKSTFSNNSNKHDTYSWDQLRMDWYDSKDYTNAFNQSVDDKEFGSKVNAKFMELLRKGNDITVDNTNLSTKRRRFLVTTARQFGYHVVGVLFPSSINTVVGRQRTRTDKTIPQHAVVSQYMHTQMPQLGEVDEVVVVGNNLLISN